MRLCPLIFELFLHFEPNFSYKNTFFSSNVTHPQAWRWRGVCVCVAWVCTRVCAWRVTLRPTRRDILRMAKIATYVVTYLPWILYFWRGINEPSITTKWKKKLLGIWTFEGFGVRFRYILRLLALIEFNINGKNLMYRLNQRIKIIWHLILKKKFIRAL